MTSSKRQHHTMNNIMKVGYARPANSPPSYQDAVFLPPGGDNNRGASIVPSANVVDDRGWSSNTQFDQPAIVQYRVVYYQRPYYVGSAFACFCFIFLLWAMWWWWW